MPGYHDPVQQNRRLSSISLDAVEEYFAQLNPIAKRIAYDINDTKANYGHLWNTLSYNERNDILNDTLIKPEISLRYFDNFLTPTPTNSSGNSYQSSTDSLTAIVFKDVNVSGDSTDQKDTDKKKVSLKAYGDAEFKTYGVKNIYSYDGRNLLTFGNQKVGLKVIQDESLGCFRDEHSRPFCYRTKSQINLFVQSPIADPIAARKAIICTKIISTNTKPALKCHLDTTVLKDDSKKTIDNYHRLQHQLKINLKEQKVNDTLKSSLSYSNVRPSNISTNRKTIKSPGVTYKFECKDKVSPTSKSSVLQNYINSTQLSVTPKLAINYAVFSDVYNTEEESSNLLHHCGQNDLNMGSCSSAATSDDDDKTLEEDVHLLDNDSNIRKGFDFLNNW